MATGFEFFERDLRVATSGLEPDEINRAVAVFAKQELRRVIAEGVASPEYERYVNGAHGLPEEAYKAPGAIVYEFTNWPLVINMALDELKKRIRSKSGRYASSFIVLADQKIVTEYRTVPAGAEVIIINYQPYTRRLDTSRTSNRRHFLGAYQALRRRFGEVFSIRNIYLNVQGGVHPMIPYVLKRHGGRKDRQAGMPITYPALVINAI